MTNRTDSDSTYETHTLSHFLDNLVCPISLTPLIYDALQGELISYHSGYAFRLVDGQALMRITNARRLSDEEIKKKPLNPQDD